MRNFIRCAAHRLRLLLMPGTGIHRADTRPTRIGLYRCLIGAGKAAA
ncbi:hypothetical protein ACWY4P_21355 [Streptomyces sp. LZ34]